MKPSPFTALSFVALTSACGEPPPVVDEEPPPLAQPPAKKQGPTAADASAFVDTANADLKKLWSTSARAGWVKETYITDDTEVLSAAAEEEVMEYTAKSIQGATRFDGLELAPDVGRSLRLLKVSSSLPAPDDEKKRAELAMLSSKMVGMYGKGAWCPEGVEQGDEKCLDLEELSKIIHESKDPRELEDAWLRWRTISPPMRPMYQRFVELGNEGAREIGFQNLGELWRSRYDMKPEEFEAMVGKLWEQVRPLYEELHCYTRKRLAEKYPEHVKREGTLPAHLLGNMWSQAWSNIYPLVEPYPKHASLDVSSAVKKKKLSPEEMVKMGESFFTSLGLEALPESFWQRSLFVKPKEREVVCHASAWDITYAGDVRIKMCIEPTEDDLITIHHELGHIYYFLAYNDKPALFQDGANDGFHEAIGDAIALSVTPSYYKERGILDSVKDDDKAVVNVQMKEALDKIAFLPFGMLVDKWRWDVFSGKTPPGGYNASWWELRTKLQGVHPPKVRSEDDFDPGAKFHVPANVPYMRYFLAAVLQFQFHRSLCQAAGHQGPLHTCSIYENKEAGKRLKAVLELGSSKPWPDALFAMTGQREMDATAIVDYFAPLRSWMKEQIAGEKCGW